MKVTGYRLYPVPPRWLFLKVETDEGISGWGEPVVEGRLEAVQAMVDVLMEYVVGKDPRPIEDHFQTLYRGGFYRGGPVHMSALAGIEQALWDIKGKYYGLPVWEMLGGKARQRIQAYAWIGGDRPHDVVAQAQQRKAQGFRAVKMNATEEMHYIDTHRKVQAVLERVAAVREAMGPDFGIALDFHGRVHKAMAKILVRELEPFNLLFVEEPVLPEHEEALAEVARVSPVPIAAGERLYSRWDFKRLLAHGWVDIIQPDLSHAGGILEVRKIAAMAEAYDIAVAPHCPLGPIALAASLAVDTCTPNAVMQELSLGIHYNDQADLMDYVADHAGFALENGELLVLDRPGLGVEVNEEVISQAAQQLVRWRNPVWRNADGTVAEW